VMGFDQCDREREWSVSEIDTLKAAAGILGATIDRQGTQRVVQQAEENYRQLVEQIPVVTYMDALDELGSTIYISPQLEAMLGYTPEEWIAELGIWVRVLYPEDRRRVLAEHQRVQATGERLDIEYRVIRRDGRPVWVRDESVLVRDASGRPLFRQGVVVDIDGRKLAEEHLREAETRYRNLVERLPAVTYVVSAPGVPLGQSIAYVSPQIEELLGCTRQEWLETETSWRKFVHPDDLDRIVAAWNAIAARGEPYSAEYRVVHRDGSVRWVRDEAVLMRDELGRPMFWQGIMIDATERKRAEDTLRTALEREREVAQGLRALDEMKNTFLAAVSHELRTPLSAILGFALTLDREDVEIPPAEARELLRRLAANARKLDRLLSDLLDLDRLSRGIVEPRRRLTDISALVRQVVDDADMVEHHPIRVQAEPVTISVDPAKVERILENLIVNAGRYTPPGTTILVSVTAQGGGVLIAVDDEGPGVSEDLREAIFEPFRQGPARLTHSPGVGVGLTLVARFAELHGGRAWMEPRGSGGSSFRVFLPSPLPEPGRERG